MDAGPVTAGALGRRSVEQRVVVGRTGHDAPDGVAREPACRQKPHLPRTFCGAGCYASLARLRAAGAELLAPDLTRTLDSEACNPATAACTRSGARPLCCNSCRMRAAPSRGARRCTTESTTRWALMKPLACRSSSTRVSAPGSPLVGSQLAFEFCAGVFPPAEQAQGTAFE